MNYSSIKVKEITKYPLNNSNPIVKLIPNDKNNERKFSYGLR